MNAIVLCHNGAAETVARHMPGWRAAFSEIMLISPSDDYMPGSLPMGLSSKEGPGNLERMMFAAVIASRFPAACVMEYDTALFGVHFADVAVKNGIGSTFPGDGKMLCSRVYVNDDSRFSADVYGHSPWIATGKTWWEIVRAGADNQRGVPDRWLAQAAVRANAQLLSIDQAFSCDREWTGNVKFAAATAATKGARIFHGVKTERDFMWIEKFTSRQSQLDAITRAAETEHGVKMACDPEYRFAVERREEK